jgi:hypothetical protein
MIPTDPRNEKTASFCSSISAATGCRNYLEVFRKRKKAGFQVPRAQVAKKCKAVEQTFARWPSKHCTTHFKSLKREREDEAAHFDGALSFRGIALGVSAIF